ncbi:hypothetical protein R9X49_20485 [Pectobacterium carotovorum]|uniref:hypothetical protein n=1 Tax=Pectobacterium carotovorum TaxID=554 RepID=UPI0029DD2037|nr:hypothetical protein [Pectobacterium carotovorum]MDX6917490.1 hypothetical protein [Pectobacterium carotovorum]
MKKNNIFHIRSGASNNLSQVETNDDLFDADIKCFINALAYKRPGEVITEILTQIENINNHICSLAVNQKEITRMRTNLYKAWIASKALESHFENKDQPADLDF